MGRAVGENECGRVVERKTGRERQHCCSVCDCVGGKTPSSTERRHSVAHLQVCDIAANGIDHARVFGARNEGQRRFHLVFVLHDEQIREVQARCADCDPHLACLRLGCRHFFPDKCLDANGIFTKPSMHAGVSRRGSRQCCRWAAWRQVCCEDDTQRVYWKESPM